LSESVIARIGAAEAQSDTLTTLPVPAFLVAKAPVALPAASVTVSPLRTPASVALSALIVAVVVAS
jgi:hypothetical protein